MTPLTPWPTVVGAFSLVEGLGARFDGRKGKHSAKKEVGMIEELYKRSEVKSLLYGATAPSAAVRNRIVRLFRLREAISKTRRVSLP